jgi:hypothetical protein
MPVPHMSRQVVQGIKVLKSRRHYLERAAYLRRLAEDAVTETLRLSCLRKAQECEALAEEAARADGDDGLPGEA